MAKMSVGDALLIKGPSHIEKALIKSIEKGVYTLDNMLKINQNLEIVDGVKNTRLVVTLFDEVEYNYGVAKSKISRYATLILSNYRDLKDKESVIKIANKLERICQKYLNR